MTDRSKRYDPDGCLKSNTRGTQCFLRPGHEGDCDFYGPQRSNDAQSEDEPCTKTVLRGPTIPCIFRKDHEGKCSFDMGLSWQRVNEACHRCGALNGMHYFPCIESPDAKQLLTEEACARARKVLADWTSAPVRTTASEDQLLKLITDAVVEAYSPSGGCGCSCHFCMRCTQPSARTQEAGIGDPRDEVVLRARMLMMLAESDHDVDLTPTEKRVVQDLKIALDKLDSVTHRLSEVPIAEQAALICEDLADGYEDDEDDIVRSSHAEAARRCAKRIRFKLYPDNPQPTEKKT